MDWVYSMTTSDEVSTVEVSKGSNYDTGKSLKERQSSHTIILRKPHEVFFVSPKNCWHEGIWLIFREERDDGTYLVRKIPPRRVVDISWIEEVK